mgnify:CR=1 FL=1
MLSQGQKFPGEQRDRQTDMYVHRHTYMQADRGNAARKREREKAAKRERECKQQRERERERECVCVWSIHEIDVHMDRGTCVVGWRGYC